MRRTRQPTVAALANVVLVSGQQSYQSETSPTSTLSPYSTSTVIRSYSTTPTIYPTTTAVPYTSTTLTPYTSTVVVPSSYQSSYSTTESPSPYPYSSTSSTETPSPYPYTSKSSTSTSTPKPYQSTSLTTPSPYQGTTPTPTYPASVCTGQTLNVPGASLDWWYGSTLYDAVATLSAEYDSYGSSTGWTVIPATTPFNLATALQTPACTSSLVYDAQISSSIYSVTCSAPATPVAAYTTVITQVAYQSPTASQGLGPAPSVVATPPPAAITVGNGGGAFAVATPFVYFSKYEIITRTPVTQYNGAVDCSTITSTYPMASPFSFAYTGPNPNGTSFAMAGVTGPVNPAFLPVVNATQAKAGEWLAAPTVAIIVQQVFAASLAPRQGPVTQISASQLQTIRPTFPSFLTPLGPPSTQHFGGPPPPQRQSSAPSLQIPSGPWTTVVPFTTLTALPTVAPTTAPILTTPSVPTTSAVTTAVVPSPPATTTEVSQPTAVPYNLASSSAISISAALAALGMWTVAWL